MFWILIVAAGALLSYFIFIKPYKYWPKHGVPAYNWWQIWKLMFEAFTRKRSIAEGIQTFYDDFPGVRYAGSYQLHKPVLLIRDPDLIKQITVKDFDHFVDHSQGLVDESEPLLAKNLISLKGDKWRDMRSTLSPSFTSSKMKMMFGLMSECANQFVDYFQQQDSKIVKVEMKEAFSKFTIDVIASTAFGVSCDSMRDPDNEFYRMGKKVVGQTISLWQLLKFLFFMTCPRLRKALGFKLADEEVNSFFRKLVKENIEARERDGIVRLDMIHLLMEARKGIAKSEKPVEDIPHSGLLIVDETCGDKIEKPQKEQLTDDNITAQAMIFFFAGFEGVATLMSFLSYELAINPDIQERLRNEVDTTLNSCQGTLTYEALLKMKYMDMVVLETLRKWPGAVATDRLCVKPCTIQPIQDGESPIYLQKGDMVFVPIFGLHRDAHIYPEPERFDPERFSEENKPSLNSYAFMPFGAGPRICIGSRFALLEAKLVLFYILCKFSITVIDKTPIPFKFARNMFQLYPEGGFWLGLQPREA